MAKGDVELPRPRSQHPHRPPARMPTTRRRAGDRRPDQHAGGLDPGRRGHRDGRADAGASTLVAMAWIGDGATSTGAFHEGLNFAAVQKSRSSSSPRTTSTPTRRRSRSRWRSSGSTSAPPPTASRTSWWTATTCSPSTTSRSGWSIAPAPARARRSSASTRCACRGTRSTTMRGTCRRSCSRSGRKDPIARFTKARSSAAPRPRRISTTSTG